MVHDALMYLTTHEDLVACLQTAAEHCRPGGVVLLLPDVVRERFSVGKHAACRQGHRRGASVRLMEWHWDPDIQGLHLSSWIFLCSFARTERCALITKPTPWVSLITLLGEKPSKAWA